MTEPRKSVAVIVPCRNEALTLPAFLNSLRAQDLAGIDLEVLVADGHSQDGTRDLLERFAAEDLRVRLIDNPEGIVSTGLNAAVRASAAEIIIRMDVHTQYREDYIRRCLECLGSSGADNVGGPARTLSQATPLSRALSAAYHSSFACGGARFHDPNYEGSVDTVPYGCWRRDTLIQLGLFDEALVRNQDDELNLRMLLAGMKIWQSPSIVSWYRPRAELSALFRQYMQYGFWKVAVIRKHRRTASVRHLVPGVFVLMAILLPVTAAVTTGFGLTWAGYAAFLSWTAMMALYAISCLLAAVAAQPVAGTRAALLLPVIFAAYHSSYGLGFLAGLCYWPLAPRKTNRRSGMFAALTR